jgi:hypothetical protein
LHPRALALSVVIFAIVACQSQPPAPALSSWTIRPASDSGPITRNTDDAELVRVYGSANVKDERIDIGEGETVPGTALFPADSTRRLMIIWSDSTEHRLPRRLILRGDSSRWSVAEGITLGTTLEELEKLNGVPFTLAGFGWDYAGVILDWHGGRLATPLGCCVKLYLVPQPSAQSDPAYNSVLGDRDYASDLPAMHQLRPTVQQIFIDFTVRDDTAAQYGPSAATDRNKPPADHQSRSGTPDR